MAYSTETLTDAAENYLDSLHSTLFSQAFDLSQPDRKRQCAEWIVDLIRDVERCANVMHYSNLLEEVMTKPISDNGRDTG